MLTHVAEGVLVHQSEFCQSNAVVVQGQNGVLPIDRDHRLRDQLPPGRPVRVGTDRRGGLFHHPHWDHLLWHEQLGPAPRYCTACGASTVREKLSDPATKTRIAEHLPPLIAGHVPLDLLGLVAAVPAGTTLIPWNGPRVRIIEHQAHAPGHAALLIEEHGVLVAGDMLSDVLVPMLDLAGVADPVGEYLAGLHLLQTVTGDVEVLVPGHGSVARTDQVQPRVEQDRAYVQALRDGLDPHDPRVGPSAKAGWAWVSDVHAGQVRSLA